MIQATARVESLIDVPLNVSPPPKVNSGVIRIIPDGNKRALIDSMHTLGLLPVRHLVSGVRR